MTETPVVTELPDFLSETPIHSSATVDLTNIAPAAVTVNAEKRLAKAAEYLADLGEGRRHSHLYSLSWTMGRLVASGHLTTQQIEEEFYRAAVRNGNVADERGHTIRRTIHDGIAKGIDEGPAPDHHEPSRVEVGEDLPEDETSDDAPVSYDAYGPSVGLGRTDSANASRLARLHGDKLRYIVEWKSWAVWDGTHWERDPSDVLAAELAKHIAQDIFKDALLLEDETPRKRAMGWAFGSANAHRIAAALKLARGVGGIPISLEDLDRQWWLLGVRNGVIDLRTATHRDALPEDLMTMQAAVTYDPNATCPQWEKAVAAWFPDPSMRDYLQRLCGHALVGTQEAEHIVVIHYGDGANGKGTFFRVIGRILGPYFTVLHKSLLVHTRHTAHDTEVAKLFRTRLAVAVETDKRQRLAEAQLKNLTGGDRISARRLYENPWEFEPTHSLHMQTNFLPEIEGRDEGIWRRVKVLPWTETFDGSRRDNKLATKLQIEAPGILNWLIEGVLAWQENGLDEPDAVVKATAAYRETEDILARFAGQTGLTFDTNSLLPHWRLLIRIETWCTEEGIGRPPPAKDVTAFMHSHNATDRRQNIKGEDGVRRKLKVWTGARFKEGETEADAVDTPLQ